MYDAGQGKTTFETNKLFIAPKSGYVMSFIGTALYFNENKPEWFNLPLNDLAGKLADYLREQRPKVAQIMTDSIPDEDENKPHLCVLLMGMYKGYPTLAQFNSFSDFEPKYLWTKEEPKFSTILYGDDSKKNEIFKDSTEYMEYRASKAEEMTPGVMAEILTRGIYRKADEEKKAFGKKWAGGLVNAASVSPQGTLALSNFRLIGG